MLVSIIYPVADLRGFVPDSGRLSQPAWPKPSAGHDFLRHIGMSQERINQGLRDWVGEDLHIDAGRGVRFGESRDSAGPVAIPSPFYCAYRRLFFDGLAVAKMEIGLSDDQATRTIKRSSQAEDQIAPSYGNTVTAAPERYRDVYALNPVATSHFNVPVRIANPYERAARVTPLGDAAAHIARLYAAATTVHNRMVAGAPPKWWVQAGQPLVIVVADRRDTWITLPEHTRTLSSPNPEAPELHHYSLRYGGGLRRVWIISHDAHSDGPYTRSLRIHLARLHTEHECLRLILSSMRTGQLALEAKSHEAAALEAYFEHVFDTIAQSETAQQGELGSNPAAWARESESALSAADAKEIRRIAQAIGFGVSLREKIDRYLRDSRAIEDDANFTPRQALEQRNKIREAMVEAFSQAELDDLRAQLGIDEEFIVQAKSAYVNAFIAYVDRRGQFEDLVALCRKQRPNREEFR